MQGGIFQCFFSQQDPDVWFEPNSVVYIQKQMLTVMIPIDFHYEIIDGFL